MNNLSQIAKAAGMLQVATLVAFLSISNCLGRIVAGAVADVCSERGRPRALPLAGVTLLMAAAHLAGLANDEAAVYLQAVLAGGAYGCISTVHPLVSADRFGTDHIGAIYATICTANGFGSYLLANTLASRVYAKHNVPGHQVCHTSSRGISCDCLGPDCYATTHVVCAALCGVAGLCCVALVRRAQSWGTAEDARQAPRAADAAPAAPAAPFYPPVSPPTHHSIHSVDFQRLASECGDSDGGDSDGGGLDDDDNDDDDDDDASPHRPRSP